MKNIDCTVTCLERVYKSTTSNWARPIPMRRPTNGIVFFLNGSIEYQFADSVILAQKGDIMIFPKGSIYSGTKQTDENSFYVVDFEIQESDILAALSLPRKISFSNFVQIEHLFSDLLAAWNLESSHGTLSCKAKLYELLSAISYSDHSSSNDYPHLFSQMVDYIQNNYQNASLSVNVLCSVF